MLIKRRKHSVPALNTTSTADISFMLLIFFLVTSSMDIDQGLVRQLPPIDNQEDNSEAMEVGRNNTLSFKIQPSGDILLDGKTISTNGLRNRIAAFIRPRTSNHVIYIDSDPKADYNSYFKLEDEIVAAYNTVRNETAHRIYHRPYAECTDIQKKDIAEQCPQHIAETYNTSDSNTPTAADENVEKGGTQ